MPKNILQDIKPISRHSSEKPVHIPPAEPRKPRAHTPTPPPSSFASEVEVRPLRYGPWIIAGISLLVLFFATAENTLSFSLMTLSAEETATVSASEVKKVDQKATGKVIVYNNYSAASQPLATETRLETKDGKIFKIQGATSIPGTTIKNGETVPGSLEVTVYADKAGEAYNIGLTDFTILGFKGTPKYTKFYARSRTVMTGGSSGTAYVAGVGDSKSAYDAAVLRLTETLKQKAKAELPKGFLLYDDAIMISTSQTSLSTASTSTTIPITVHGILNAFIFNEKNLTTKIAEKTISQYDGEPVTIPAITSLVLTLKNKDKLVPATTGEISFSLTGATSVIWEIDEMVVRTALLGKKKNDFQNLLVQYPNIDSAKVIVRPFWRSRFPEKIKNIKIINANTLPQPSTEEAVVD